MKWTKFLFSVKLSYYTMSGIKRSEETKQKIKNTKLNMTEETKHRMKLAQAKQKPIACPHCGKEGRIAPMKRWHFDKSKLK